jgi:hypothetical protein
VTSKKHKQAIAESLSSALEPPRSRRPSPALNDILSQYAPAPEQPAPASATRNTLGTQSTTSTESTQSTPSIEGTHGIDTSRSLPVSPARDYQKVANSITRVAVPAGVFKGKCKQLYDFLYSKTRGSIVPSRSVRLTRREIMLGSDIGSTKTLFLNLRHLRDSGLVTWDERVGPHEGNVYTVHLPEEAGTLGTHSTQGTQSTLSAESTSSPKVDRVLGVESTPSTHTLSAASVGSSGEPKTSFKTNTERDDDEAFAGFAAAMKKVAREVTGREPSAAEAARWSELAEVLATELKIAAGRTTVSSVPAFLAEHLRRRLWKKEKRQIESEAAEGAGAAKALTKVDASQCPDCYGTGMYYPEGFDKGVARCDHKQLTEAKEQTS